MASSLGWIWFYRPQKRECLEDGKLAELACFNPKNGSNFQGSKETKKPQKLVLFVVARLMSWPWKRSSKIFFYLFTFSRISIPPKSLKFIYSANKVVLTFLVGPQFWGVQENTKKHSQWHCYKLMLVPRSVPSTKVTWSLSFETQIAQQKHLG